MRHDLFRAAVLVALSTSTGWIGWSGNVLLLPLAASFPVGFRAELSRFFHREVSHL